MALNESLSTKAALAIEPIMAKVSDVSMHLKARTSIVCGIKELKNYLNVSPTEVQWITPDYGIVYDVRSDLDWIIVTS